MGDACVAQHLHLVEVDAYDGVRQWQRFGPEIAGSQFGADGHHRVGGAEHLRQRFEDSDGAEVVLELIVDRALRVRGQDDPGPEHPGELFDLDSGAAGPGPDDEEGTLGVCQRLGGGLDCRGLGARMGAGHRRVGPPGTSCFDEVEGDLDVGGASAPCAHARQGLSDCQGHLTGACHPMAVTEDCFDRLALVADLVEESVAASRVGQRHAGADEQDWNRIGEGLQQRGQRVEHRRSRRRHDNLHRAGDAGRTVGHVPGSLFVTR